MYTFGTSKKRSAPGRALSPPNRINASFTPMMKSPRWQRKAKRSNPVTNGTTSFFGTVPLFSGTPRNRTHTSPFRSYCTVAAYTRLQRGTLDFVRDKRVLQVSRCVAKLYKRGASCAYLARKALCHTLPSIVCWAELPYTALAHGHGHQFRPPFSGRLALSFHSRPQQPPRRSRGLVPGTARPSGTETVLQAVGGLLYSMI